MISHRFRCVFVHVPKTAGQSIEAVFLQACGLSRRRDSRRELLLRPNDDPARGPERLAHLTAEEYVRLGWLTQADFDAYFTFAFVRNPWARLVSEYRYRQDYAQLPFREFVLSQLPGRDPFSDRWRHVMPQAEFVCDGSGRPLVDFVGRYEQLDADFERVRRQVGLPPGPLPHINQAKPARVPRWLSARLPRLGATPKAIPRRPYTDYYDAETRDAVAHLYEADCSLFGYRFGD